MKVLFFGSSDYCLSILESLNNNFELLGIITRPDKPVGRTQSLTASTPKQLALKNNIKVFTPSDQKSLLALQSELVKLDPNIAIVADYGLIIPKEIFTIPHQQTLNIHFSKLPQLRGASPVQYTILTGEKTAWISIQIMDKKLDTGAIVWQEEYLLTGEETTKILYERLFTEIGNRLPEIMQDYVDKKIIPRKQKHADATYTKKLTREDGYIPWEIVKAAIEEKKPSKKILSKWNLIKILPPQLVIGDWSLVIANALRAFAPWPGIWTDIEIRSQNRDQDASDGGRLNDSEAMPPPRWKNRKKVVKKRLKILKAHLEPASQGETLQASQNKLVLDLVQLEGKNPVTWKQFITAYPLKSH